MWLHRFPGYGFSPLSFSSEPYSRWQTLHGKRIRTAHMSPVAWHVNNPFGVKLEIIPQTVKSTIKPAEESVDRRDGFRQGRGSGPGNYLGQWTVKFHWVPEVWPSQLGLTLTVIWFPKPVRERGMLLEPLVHPESKITVPPCWTMIWSLTW